MYSLEDWEPVPVIVYPEEYFHLHGKALSGLRHSHALRPGENPDKPGHEHDPKQPAVALYLRKYEA